MYGGVWCALLFSGGLPLLYDQLRGGERVFETLGPPPACLAFGAKHISLQV